MEGMNRISENAQINETEEDNSLVFWEFKLLFYK